MHSAPKSALNAVVTIKAETLRSGRQPRRQSHLLDAVCQPWRPRCGVGMEEFIYENVNAKYFVEADGGYAIIRAVDRINGLSEFGHCRRLRM